jgi:UDP-GlcNAc:undecaprenyl-phosphate GlcNAc-1-phosphate transferase
LKTSIASFFFGFIVALWLTPVARRLAIRFRLLDRAQGGRRVHQKSIPRTGGLAIAAGVLAPILALAFYEKNVIGQAIYADMAAIVVLFVGALAALAVGLADDLVRPSAKLRLLALVGIAALTWFGGHRVDEVALPWLGKITMGAWSLPVTVLWIVGVIVAFNFVDGLDGLASGIALISTSTLFVYAQIDQNVLWMTWTGAIAGALLGFLVFNFHPASIFMGDAGSNFLGYMLAVVALQTSRKEATALSLAVPLCVLGLPLLDVSLTMVRRALLRQGLFTSERGHLHHRLLELGLTHRRAVLVLYAVTAVLCLGAVLIREPLFHLRVIIAAFFTVVVFSLLFATGYIRPRHLLQMYHQGKANKAKQQRIEAACLDLAQCLKGAGGDSFELPQILEELVERTCVTGVQYRCEHGGEVVAGAYDRYAKGTRFEVQSGRSGAAAAVVFWQDRGTDPTPTERAALRMLFATLECFCAAVAVSPGAEQGAPVPTQKTLRQSSAKAQLDKVWAAIVESAGKLSLQRIQLEVDLPWLSEGFNATWANNTPEVAGKSWRMDLPVMSESRIVGCLRVIGDSSRASPRHDIAILLNVLDTCESYLHSVFRDLGQIPVPEAAPYSNFGRGRLVQSNGKPADARIEQGVK